MRLHKIENYQDMAAMARLNDNPDFKRFMDALAKTDDNINRLWRARRTNEDLYRDQGAAELLEEIQRMFKSANDVARRLQALEAKGPQKHTDVFP